MVDPLEMNLVVPADRTETRLFIQTDGLGLHTADKKEHIHPDYTQKQLSISSSTKKSLDPILDFQFRNSSEFSFIPPLA